MHQDGARSLRRGGRKLLKSTHTPRTSQSDLLTLSASPQSIENATQKHFIADPFSQIVRFTIASKSLSLPMTLIPDPYHHTLAHVIDWHSLALARFIIAFIVFSQHLSGDRRVDADAALEREARGDLRALLVLEEADHRLAEAGRDARDRRRVVVVGARRHHRARARRRVLALEDARADEDAVDAELHQHRDVGGGGEAAGGEGDDGEAAVGAHLLDELDGDAELLRVPVEGRGAG